MKIEAEVFRQLSVEDIEERVTEIKAVLASLRQKKNSGDIEPEDIKTSKKNLARALTVRREKILAGLVEKYSGTPMHKLPKELRPRLNKAKRQALTRPQLRRKTRRQRTRIAKFPRVVFAYNE